MMLRLAALLLVVATPPAHAHDVVRIGWLRATNDLTLSRARGTLERALAALDARVEWAGPFPAASPAMEALNSGAIDVTVGSSTSAVAALAAHAPITLFAYQRLAPAGEALLVRGDSPIRTLADLPGHSVAVNRGGTGEYLLARALQTHGIDPATVRRVFLGPADAGPAFAAGAVDAWVAWDPFLTVALATYGARVVSDGATMGSHNAVVMIASREFAAGHRTLLQAVYDTLRADNAWSLANPVAAGEVWVRELRLPSAMAATLGAHDAVPTVAVGPEQAREIGSVADWSVAAGIVPVRPEVTTVDLSR